MFRVENTIFEIEMNVLKHTAEWNELVSHRIIFCIQKT